MIKAERNNGGAEPVPSWLESDFDQPAVNTDLPPRPSPPEVYTLSEVAQIFGRTERTIRKWVRNGQLQRGGFGNAVFFTRAALDALLSGRGGLRDPSSDSNNM